MAEERSSKDFYKESTLVAQNSRKRSPPKSATLTPRLWNPCVERAACFQGRGRHAWSTQAVLTIGAVYAGVLVVTEKKATVALTLVAAHGIDTDLLAATVVILTFIHICEKREKRGAWEHVTMVLHGDIPRHHAIWYCIEVLMT